MLVTIVLNNTRLWPNANNMTQMQNATSFDFHCSSVFLPTDWHNAYLLLRAKYDTQNDIWMQTTTAFAFSAQDWHNDYILPFVPGVESSKDNFCFLFFTSRQQLKLDTLLQQAAINTMTLYLSLRPHSTHSGSTDTLNGSLFLLPHLPLTCSQPSRADTRTLSQNGWIGWHCIFSKPVASWRMIRMIHNCPLGP